MITFQYGEILKTSWEKLKANYGMITAVYSVFFIISIGMALIAAWLEGSAGGKVIGQIVLFALNSFLTIGLIRCFLEAADGKKVRMATLFSGGDVFLNFLVVNLAANLLIFAGMILLIVPGIILGMMYLFVLYLVADQGAGIKEAFVKSAQITKGYRWKLFCLMALAGLINIGGALCLGLGLLVTIPWTAMFLPVTFRLLTAGPAAVPNQGEVFFNS